MTEPQAVQPSPIPTTFQVAAVTDNNTGVMFTMLSVLTATGQAVYFLDSDVAQRVGETLIKMAEATKGSGLVVPTPSLNGSYDAQQEAGRLV